MISPSTGTRLVRYCRDVVIVNFQFNWPKLFQEFPVKFTLIFFMSAFIPSFHISTM